MIDKILISFLLFSFLLTSEVFAFDGRSVYNSKSSWISQENERFALESLVGFPVVIAMIYTKCQSSCPMIISFLREFEEKMFLEIKEKVYFVLITFDESETTFNLKAYLKKQNLDVSHWIFLLGTGRSIKEIAAILGIKFKQMDDGEYSHSNIISLLDKNGVLIYQQSVDDRNYSNMLTILKNMIAR